MGRDALLRGAKAGVCSVAAGRCELTSGSPFSFSSGPGGDAWVLKNFRFELMGFRRPG